MILLEDVCLDYPILDLGAHSLQVTLHKQMTRMIGGKIDSSNTKVNALSNISFSVKDGQRVGIIGHNGSGKTTLLRVISGVYTPTKGKIKVEGNLHSLTDFTLGMDPDVSGIKNIIFRLIFMGFSFEQAKKAVDEIIEFSELEQFINMPVRTYSTGMFLRLAFAISTYVPPDILVLDEIIGAGDEAFKEKVLKRLDTLFTQSRIVVLSSHDLASVAKYCDTVILMGQGKVLKIGKADEVINQYYALTQKNNSSH